jgi:thiosulfate/3-mercaptopyruvate sulfurtransferase
MSGAATLSAEVVIPRSLPRGYGAHNPSRQPRRQGSSYDRSVRYQFVDCRWELGRPERGRELYLEGHVPGASFLDVDGDLSDLAAPDQGRHPLPSAKTFARAASRAGIGHGVFVIAYGSFGGAERLWWLLRHFGHDDVAVLGGGIDAWRGPLRAGEETIEPAEFEVTPRSGDTIDADELLARLDDDDLVIVDARLPERFRGEPNPIDSVPGRIPGARNVPYTNAATLPKEALAAKELVVYCGSGVTACVDLFALARAGRPDAKLYPGSWSDWAARGLPLERG